MNNAVLRMEYPVYIKMREKSHLDRSNGFQLKSKGVFKNSSEMNKALDVLWLAIFYLLPNNFNPVVQFTPKMTEFIFEFRQMKSSRVPLSGLAHVGALLANGGRDWRSGESLFRRGL